MATEHMTTGQRIARARHRKGWDQATLAEKVGRSVSWLSKVEPPEPEVIPDIAKLFDLPEETVFEMIALQWYGVKPRREHSDMADAVAHIFDQLPKDAQDATRAVVAAFYSHAVQDRARELQRRYEAGENLLAP